MSVSSTLESETLTVPGRGESLTVDYRYNNDIAPSAIVYPGSQQVVQLLPNAFGEPTQVASSGQSYATNIDFHASGGVKSFTYGNGVTHQSVLDSVSNLPIQVSDMKGMSRVMWFDYEYDNNANITQLLDGTDSGYHLNTLSYDGLDRLIGTSGNSKAGNASVDYDALGNITQLVTHNRTLDYHYNTALNRLTSVNGSGAAAKSYSSFDYDTRGNITNNSHVEMSYNLANQMTAALGKSYTYDGHNRRVKVAGDGDTRYYLYSQSGQLLLSEDNGVQTNYIYLGNRLIAEDRQATTTFIHTDRLGSPVARTNSTGRVESRRHYQPFGDTYEAPSDDIGYTGHKYDNDLGLSYMQARYYDPVIGRFYSNDPVGTAEFIAEGNIQGFNRYSYVNNNPYKYVDPDGEKLEFAAGSSATFKKQFAEIRAYHKAGGTDGVFNRLDARSEIITIKEGGNHDFSFNPSNDSVTFDPTSGLEVALGKVQTPALGVLHELGHAEDHLNNATQEQKDFDTKVSGYGNVAEKKVIQNYETSAAQKLGEPTRQGHNGTPVRVKCSTCDQ